MSEYECHNNEIPYHKKMVDNVDATVQYMVVFSNLRGVTLAVRVKG